MQARGFSSSRSAFVRFDREQRTDVTTAETRRAEFSCNPTHYLTVGIEHIWQKVDTARKLKRSIGSDLDVIDNEDGSIVLFPEMSLLSSRYKYAAKLARGTFSVLIAAYDLFSQKANKQQQPQLVAIKIMNKEHNRIGIQEALRLHEINATDSKKFSGVVRLLNTFHYKSHYCIVLELLNATLQKYKDEKKLTMKDIRWIAFQLLSTVSFLHSNEYIHADLKPENILLGSVGDSLSLQNSTLKLVDFGNTMKVSETSYYSNARNFEVQTLHYRAPELILGINFGKPIDVWSIGCIIAELLIGTPMFDVCTTPKELLHCIVQLLGPLPQAKYKNACYYNDYYDSSDVLRDYSTNEQLEDWPLHSYTDESFSVKYKYCQAYNNLKSLLATEDRDLIDLMLGLLEIDPEERLTAKEALFHPFFGQLMPFELCVGSGNGNLYCERSTWNKIVNRSLKRMEDVDMKTDVSISGSRDNHSGSDLQSILNSRNKQDTTLPFGFEAAKMSPELSPIKMGTSNNNNSDDAHMAIDPSEDDKSEADKELETLKQISQRRQFLQQKLEQKVAAKKSVGTGGTMSAKKEDPKSRQISPAPSKISISSQNRYKNDNSSMSEGESAQLGPSDLILNDSFDGLDILTIQSDVRSEQTKPKPVALSNSRKRLMEERNESEEQAKKKQKLLPQANPLHGSAKLGGRYVAVPPKASSKPSYNSNSTTKSSKTTKK